MGDDDEVDEENKIDTITDWHQETPSNESGFVEEKNRERSIIQRVTIKLK